MQFRQRKERIDDILKAIRAGKLDLRPSFQRGDIWNPAKQQRLIDSVLRKWYVPPVHLVHASSGGGLEVLDGQQRLRAILEFANDEFPFNGEVLPDDSHLARLHGLRYSELPGDLRAKFDEFEIALIILEDYRPDEPGEMFFRLNQPSTLTTAEQRNAFFGEARDQVRGWVDLLERSGVKKASIGFSNVRMAYDDTLARFALTVERGTLSQKVTADDLVSLYRSERGYSGVTSDHVKRTIKCFADGLSLLTEPASLNKATFFSWLVFTFRGLQSASASHERGFARLLGPYIGTFGRALKPDTASSSQRDIWNAQFSARLLSTFHGRATSRVADVSSVLLRDVILWSQLQCFVRMNSNAADLLHEEELRRLMRQAARLCEVGESTSPYDEEAFAQMLAQENWGRLT